MSKYLPHESHDQQDVTKCYFPPPDEPSALASSSFWNRCQNPHCFAEFQSANLLLLSSQDFGVSSVESSKKAATKYSSEGPTLLCASEGSLRSLWAFSRTPPPSSVLWRGLVLAGCRLFESMKENQSTPCCNIDEIGPQDLSTYGSLTWFVEMMWKNSICKYTGGDQQIIRKKVSEFEIFCRGARIIDPAPAGRCGSGSRDRAKLGLLSEATSDSI